MRLADRISRYGRAIEWDLQTRCGVDLGEYWRDRRRHRKLLNLIDHLPGDSAFIAAMLDDPQAAAAVAAGRVKVADEGDTGPSTREWSPLREGLARIEDRLAIQTIATLAAAGAKQLPKFKPASRPTSAMADALKAAQRLVEQTKFEEIVRLFAPHEFDDDDPPPGG